VPGVTDGAVEKHPVNALHVALRDADGQRAVRLVNEAERFKAVARQKFLEQVGKNIPQRYGNARVTLAASRAVFEMFLGVRIIHRLVAVESNPEVNPREQQGNEIKPAKPAALSPISEI
jgi:hypothetical protein